MASGGRARTAHRGGRRLPSDGCRPASSFGSGVSGESDTGRSTGSDGPGWGQLDAVLADVMKATGASVGLIYLLPPGERVLRLAVVSGVSRSIASPWARVPCDAPVPVAVAVRRRRIVWLAGQEDMARHYPRVGLVLPYDFRLAAAPIVVGATARGGIVLLWPTGHPSRLSARERHIVGGGCRSASRVLRQAAESGRPLLPQDEPRLLHQKPSQEPGPGQATAAFEFAERLPDGCCSLNVEGRIVFLNSACAELVGADAEALLGTRPWESLPWLRDPVFEDRYRAAVIARQPTTFTARRPPDTWLSFRLFPGERGVSVHITVAATEHPPSPQDRSPDETAQPGGATALYHLTHLAAMLSEAVRVTDVVELVADQLVPAFGPAALALMTVEEGRLHVAGHRGCPADLVAGFDAVPLSSETPAACVLSTGVPAFFSNAADLASHSPAAHHGQMGAWAFLPLTASGTAIGTLALAYDQPHPFTPPERAVLTSLAGLLAQTLDRARLYDNQRQLAHSLQTGLLPHRLAGVPNLEVAARYLPAGHGMDIGGDFYDLVRCDDTSAAAAIGDVQGHNTTAAALMGQVRTAVHTHATAGASPGEILARTNQLLIDLDTGLFTSCLYAHLDLPRREVRLATAGHPPPLLRHPDGRTEILDVPPGLLLGIEAETDYTTVSVRLEPGSVLVLYTDGLVEIPGGDIGDSTAALARRLAEAAADQSLDDLADTLTSPAFQPTPPTDDIALLLVRPTAEQVSGNVTTHRP
ncbi:SpoIIE family protein phosphatase [Streptomyces sp. DW4-2]|uniref:SpoIIE family protein phosphatase n=1 Tax=Streptomyces spirodelae TaxID=2812904 RepID=A0ABS3WXE2_9ACTN|nr:SpoIIE family protein phosphatase [Streptomyces spirodelae]